MQMAVIEFARNVLDYKEADSTEINAQTKYPVISLMDEQKNLSYKGGTMRLGNWACQIERKSKAFQIYGKESIEERHRHRYEFNNEYLEAFREHGMKTSGVNPDTGLVEIIELENHPF
ncbi:unnamed protein product, partial [Cyprideis torosa]